MQQKNSNFSTLIIERLKSEMNTSKDKDLAEILNIKQNTLSTWKGRDAADLRMIIELCEKEEFDLNYIILGKSKGVEENSNKSNDSLLITTVDKLNRLEAIVETIQLKITTEDDLKSIMLPSESLKQKN